MLCGYQLYRSACNYLVLIEFWKATSVHQQNQVTLSLLNPLPALATIVVYAFWYPVPAYATIVVITTRY